MVMKRQSLMIGYMYIYYWYSIYFVFLFFVCWHTVNRFEIYMKYEQCFPIWEELYDFFSTIFSIIFMFSLIPYKYFSVSLPGYAYEGESMYSQSTQVVISLSARCVIDYSTMDVRLAERFMHSDHLFLPERDRRNGWSLSMQSSRTGRITLAHDASVSCVSSVHYSPCPGWLNDWLTVGAPHANANASECE